MAGASVVLAKVVPKKVVPKAVLVSRLKDEIFAMRYSRLENKFYIGQKLWQLQQLHGKPGRGTFLDDLAELDIPTTSAYRCRSSGIQRRTLCIAALGQRTASYPHTSAHSGADKRGSLRSIFARRCN